MSAPLNMRNLPDEERPWKHYSSSGPPPSLTLHLSNGKRVILPWFVVTGCQVDSVKNKSDRDPITITISVGRASYGVAVFKENAEELIDELAGRKIVFIRPVHPVIEIGKIKTTQPD